MSTTYQTADGVVELSSILSLASVLLCFLCMIIFILRLSANYPGGGDMSCVVYPKHATPAISMVGVHNPFILNLASSGTAHTGYGVGVRVSASCRGFVQAIWGPEITEFYHELSSAWSVFRNRLTSGEFLSGKCICKSEQILLDECPEKFLQLTPIDVTAVHQLGGIPRSRYPLVIVQCCLEEDMTEQEEQTSPERTILVMATAIHIKDDTVTTPSHIITQLVKTYSGHVYPMQQLYMPSVGGEETTSPAGESSSTRPETSQGGSQVVEGRSQVVERSAPSQGRSPVVEGGSPVVQRSGHSQGRSQVVERSGPSQGRSKVVERSGPRQGRSQVVERSGPSQGVSPVVERSGLSQSESKVVEGVSQVVERSGPSQGRSQVVDGGSPVVERVPGSRVQPTITECVVCQTSPVAVAMLPCRHACSCLSCFKHLDRCPMCRGHIASYFTLPGVHDSVQRGDEEEEEEERPRQTMYRRFVHWNDRLNHWMGLG